MYSLTASVQGHYESLDSIIYFTISVLHIQSKTSWVCNRKLEEFHELYNSLINKYTNIPYPPGYTTISYLKLFFQSTIVELNAFITAIFSLPGIFTCEEISDFFSVSLHIQLTEKLSPTLTHEFTTRYPTFHIFLEQKAIFLADTDTSILYQLDYYMKKIGYSGTEVSIIRCITEKAG